MQSAELESFNQAVALANAGRKAEAHTLLSQLLQRYPNDSNILLWFAFTTEDLNQAQQALLRVRALDPNNPALPGAESWLRQALPPQSVATDPVSVDFLVTSSTSKTGATASYTSSSSEQVNNGNEAKSDSSAYTQSGYQSQDYGQAPNDYYQSSGSRVVYRQESPGFFDRIVLGWQFLKQAISMARENPGLMLPSLYALGGNLLIGLLLGLPLAIIYSSNKNSRGDFMLYIALFLVVLLNYLVTYFFSAIITHLVYQHITTGQSDKSRAWAAANQNGITILMVAAVSALVSTIRTAIRNQRRGIPGVIASVVIGIIERVWTTATMFIIPAIVLEDRKLGDAVGRATYIIKGNLLQLGIGYIGLALVSNLLSFAAVLGSFGLALLIFVALAKASLLAALILAGLIILIALALTTTFQAYLKIAYYTCLYKWACDNEKLGGMAQAPAPLHTILASRAYSY